MVSHQIEIFVRVHWPQLILSAHNHSPFIFLMRMGNAVGRGVISSLSLTQLALTDDHRACQLLVGSRAGN